MNRTHLLSRLSAVDQQQTLANGAILVDDFDKMIFDEVLRRYPAWTMIDKRLAPGDFTNGFDQTAVGAARAANKRSLTYSATSPTRAARTQQEVKCIVNDLTLGMYDRSVYQQQGRRFGDLTMKDVQDAVTSCFREWARQFHLGDTNSDSLEYNGWRKQLGSGNITFVNSDASVVKTIQDQIVVMMNSTARDVMPTFINCNARVRRIIHQELQKMGDKLLWEPVPGSAERLPFLDTAAGALPLLVDPWNTVGTGGGTNADIYPTLIGSGDKMSWQYIEPLGEAGAEPKTFEIVMNNTLDTQYKTVMFGTLELLGAANHFKRIDVEDRSVAVDPTA